MGFTLLELLVVMVIIAVVLAVSAPRLVSFFADEKLNGAAAGLASFLNYSREVALIKRRSCQVVREDDRNRLRILVQKDPLNAPQEYEPLAESYDFWDIPSGLTLSCDRNDGTHQDPLYSNAKVTYTLQDQAGAKAMVIVQAGSGRAVVVAEE
ncbi:MAG: hypothetical protein A3K19_07055 [Lentisphaerae bacterium RIFOXYB12_FULL_65_16]|nr:MAG: hypothetical protein A3K18_12270 [Lentisphaerae bacterium RIFOXYA12_64_32]OGV93280.1 MAG: hypothetical protein A3K19_07055 [Lentisphaerae bacterium RIFOXYB12_FULL_65_16]